MVFKMINATDARSGTNIVVDGNACTVKSMDVSKTGKHGHAKCRIEAVGIVDGKKRVFVIPGHDKLEVPLVEKRKGQVLSKNESAKMISVMDLESFETIDVPCDAELMPQLEESGNVEYWDIEGNKIAKRKL